ncbi:hypothetical protein J7E38_07445 [Bacillus sp. ISL-35]|uniref:hypothetical protein n=1 Tax=Bacillus sp. ISL-35 TaxID=2819122 RepID=UPI001BE86CD2|nr:hypothetical protein [Bacillus sp. ISL-35]MBT2678835.1 hypothetical protein [Bacillus sp. ISL-35]MBT2703827.1 hypothetical protein [Chryseobacterium sp. ISL-80]
MKKVRTLRENVKTYARPSVNAKVVNEHNNSGQELIVYPSVEGWFELRPVDTDGVMNTEFVQIRDVEEKSIKVQNDVNTQTVNHSPTPQNQKNSMKRILKTIKKVIRGDN